VRLAYSDSAIQGNMAIATDRVGCAWMGLDQQIVLLIDSNLRLGRKMKNIQPMLVLSRGNH
jgi:hypothetical protein